MSQFESLEQAAEALAEANMADEAPATPEVAPDAAPVENAERTSETPNAEPTTAQVEAEGTTVEDSFTKVDLASLTDGLDPEAASAVEQAYKSFQSDYTRKMQEASPYRQLADDFGGDLDSLRQSVEFVQNLRHDPDFAYEVHRQLADAFEDAGMSEADASAEAAHQVQQMGDDFGSEFDAEDPRDRALQELLAFKDEYEQREQERMIEMEIQRAEMAIRQSHPDYTDEDMDEIVKMSFAYGGDLFRAEQDFRSLRERWLANYVDSKGSVETRTPADPAPTHHAQQPQQFESIEDAHKAALRHLAAQLASE